MLCSWLVVGWGTDFRCGVTSKKTTALAKIAPSPHTVRRKIFPLIIAVVISCRGDNPAEPLYLRHADVGGNNANESSAVAPSRGRLSISLVRPISTRRWPALEDVEMSAITGPNEEYMITQRGLFGIWQWESLPTDLQRSTIGDLVTGTCRTQNWRGLKKTLQKNRRLCVSRFNRPCKHKVSKRATLSA